MARFDVYRTKQGEVLLDCQSDLLTDVRTRLVVPLFPVEQIDDRRLPRLMPIFKLNGGEVVMLTTLLVGLHSRDLGEKIASLADEQDAIMSAIDMLLTGY